MTPLSKIERLQLIISWIFKVILFEAFFFSIIEKEWLVLFTSSVALIAVFFPKILSRNYNIYVPVEIEFMITLFIYASLFLGEIKGYYARLWWWDSIVHGGSGVALGIVSFLVLYALYRDGRLNISIALIAIFSFSFAVTIGALWEIFEFSVDSTFHTAMQESGLHDTMWDLIVDALGAALSAGFGYFYLRMHRKRNGIFQHLLEKSFGNLE
ncbi:MAG: hypothetical protein COU07_00960 [Candidatus Harrisonbacteria bacterium CG10_big_fil_rev_8_21_14_0_10_40_38]|uniref:DUF2238 domain-containing protein n=1 Tax=Candidatus Harrisonbacteria bacterium CG10_big_fil_rev_8_21_14_0_10_40_38 TaxID=1974583 RepID=A0A2H0UUL9_9BACT|nr:MAG: hypothetical protein COU07_00960 [Candidatus Harrisonbacteria bacterium CG10_big_fil_rev_8_21_14_0_10_40_38]